ncbi:MAG TPA: methionyl-tRNA formyltransferase [Methylomirabilota bacterium]|jgi:methionyl-tRNA formyltransferase|nr:methionyl-tRNA formyltransferase [Methylomirabilota bacterium]
MKIIFAGTTEFGIPTLEKLKKQNELVLIITQPDKPAGRDKKLAPSPIKLWAQKNNIPLIQPEKIIESKSQISDYEPDLLLVAAYGQIIPKEILDIPKFKSINIHGSILPKYRGASPIQSAILNGDNVTGITLIQMDEKMDHGPMLAVKSLPLDETITFPELYQKMGVLAADLVDETLPKWFAGAISPVEQDHAAATFCKPIERADAKIDWAKTAMEINRKIRSFNPEPGTWTTLSGKPIKILSAEVIKDHKIELPGKIYAFNGEPAVKCMENALLLKKVKPDGKNEMSGKDYLNGLRSLNDKIFV